MRHFFYDSLKRFLMALSLTVVGIFSAHAATLPSGYTELEYIESTGTQYIDTGVKATNNTKVIGNFYINSGFNGQVFGSYDSSKAFRMYVPNQSVNDNVFGTASFSPIIYPADFARDTKLEIRLDKTGIYIGNNTYTYTSTPSAFSATSNMYLGAINAYTSNKKYLEGRIYDFRIYENESLIRNFVSAKNASGVVGMYDTVNNVFYTNQGTGTFTAGPIACNGTRMNYTTATGTVAQNGTPTPTNPIDPVFYKQGDMVLRKVGDYADSYDSATGKITRRVGVKVMNGTEDWFYSANGSNYLGNMYNLFINDMFAEASSVTSNRQSPYSTHFARSTNWISNSAETRLNKIQAYTPSAGTPILGLGYQDASDANIPAFKAWLTEQYANGTPVIVYYPLKTSVTEDWPAEQCVVSDGIKIATTKYTEDAFANLVTTLNSAITKVTNIVDTTVQQATEIGNLATTKQDRPDTDCPAGRKCLLIMGADNKPHWYLIQE